MAGTRSGPAQTTTRMYVLMYEGEDEPLLPVRLSGVFDSLDRAKRGWEVARSDMDPDEPLPDGERAVIATRRVNMPIDVEARYWEWRDAGTGWVEVDAIAD